MVKALAFFKRKGGMPVDEFQAYWLTRHPETVTHLAGLRRYVQSHTLPTAYHNGEPVYDGIAEVWFDDTRAMHALRGTPAMDAVVADEARFIDRSTMGLITTEEHVSKEGPARPGAAKSVGFVRRRTGMAVEAFQRHWREVHGPLGAAEPLLQRYVQSHTRLAGYDRGRVPTWDGVASLWFGSTDDLRSAVASPEFARAKADDANFIAEGPVTSIVTTEHVIVLIHMGASNGPPDMGARRPAPTSSRPGAGRSQFVYGGRTLDGPAPQNEMLGHFRANPGGSGRPGAAVAPLVTPTGF
jgi:uncharacterized protein (TIGR02118 family)